MTAARSTLARSPLLAALRLAALRLAALRLAALRLAALRLAALRLAALLLAGLGLPALALGADPAPGDVLGFVVRWQAAWQAQDADAYLALYAADASAGGRSGEALAAYKRALFARGEPLRVDLGDARVDEVDRAGERLVRVVLGQAYTSPTLTDFGEKTLLLRPRDGGWSIVRETWRAVPGGRIETPLAVQAADAADAADAAPAGAGPAPALTPSGEATPPAGEAERLAPLLGPAYVPPAAPSDAFGAESGVGDLLDLAPLVTSGPLRSLPPVAGLPEPEGDTRVIEEIVARVNGRVLTRSMLVDRIRAHEDQLLAEQPPDLAQRLAGLARETLETTIDRWLLLQEVEQRQADLGSFWRDWLEAFRVQVGAESLAAVRELLEAQGQDLARLREQVIEQEVPSIFLQQEIAERIELDDDRLRAWYDAHLEEFRRPQTVTLRQIFVPVAADGDPARAEQVALEAIDRLAAGDEWCAVEEIYGQGGGPCGNVGTVVLADLLPELREASAALPVFAVSRPLRSTLGYHVVQVTERLGGDHEPFEDVRARVRARAFDEVFEQRLATYLDGLRERAVIDVNPRYAPEALGSPVGQ